jgi:hypothetical protein
MKRVSTVSVVGGRAGEKREQRKAEKKGPNQLGLKDVRG